jgi:parallel beta-helix repeat protein
MKTYKITIVTLGLSACIAHAETWTVDDDGKADFNNLQAAADAAADGDEILVMPGTYTSTALYEVVDMRNKAVWMHSAAGADVTIIDGEGTRRGIHCAGDVQGMTIEGFTIQNCYGHTSGGGMYLDNGAQPTLKNCKFTNNSATPYGGGMCNFNLANPTLENCIFTGNSASEGGGIYIIDASSLVLDTCVFINNSSTHSGGGIKNIDCDSMFTNCTFEGNTDSGFGGGGIHFNGSNPTLTGCTFTNNTANERGGGISSVSSNAVVTLCTFTNNSANYGGGMFNEGNSNPTLSDCTFEGNAVRRGGGFYCETNCTPILTNCTFNENTALLGQGEGGGIFSGWNCDPTLIGCTFTDNSASVSGGGMHIYQDSSLTITNCTFTDNYAENGGGMTISGESQSSIVNCNFLNNNGNSNAGAIYNLQSSPTITNCDFIGNVAVTRGAGAIYNHLDANPLFEDCLFESNSAPEWGGAIHNEGSSPEFVSCTFKYNVATDGGAMVSYAGSNPVLNDCTIRENIANGQGGAIFVYSASVSITDTVICSNSTEQIALAGGGDWSDQGGNTIGELCEEISDEGACCYGANNDCIDIVVLAVCGALGGDFHGPGSVCSTQPCSDGLTAIWINSTGDDCAWEQSENWSQGAVPTSKSNVIFNQADPACDVTLNENTDIASMAVVRGNPVLDLNDNTSDYELTLSQDMIVGEGFGDEAFFTIRGGKVEANTLTLGLHSGSNGSISLKESVELTLEDDILIGEKGYGEMRVEDGSQVTVESHSYVGFSSNSFGAVVLEGENTVWETQLGLDIKRGYVYVGDHTLLKVINDNLVVLPNGWLGGTGTIEADIVNAGELLPGDASNGFGDMVVNGSYRQADLSNGRYGVFHSRIGNAGDIGSLTVNGAAVLGGGLFVEFQQDYEPGEGDTFTLIDANEVYGNFNVALFPGMLDNKYMKIIYPDEAPLRGAPGQVDLEVDVFDNLLDFGEPDVESINGTPTSMAVADFNADGLDDIVLAIAGTPGHLLVRISGDDPYTIEIDNEPRGIAIGDFNGDTYPDVSVACYANNNVSIHLNLGIDQDNEFLGFEGELLYPVGQNPVDLATVNLNGDNSADLAVSCQGDSTIEFYTASEGSPIRTLIFNEPEIVGLDGPPGKIDPGDVNDDKVSIMLTVALPGNRSIADLRKVTGINPDGNWQVETYYDVGNNPSKVVATDINQDGFNDVIVTNLGDGTIGVLLGLNQTELQQQIALPVGDSPSSVAVVDFDSDGDADIVLIASDTNDEHIVQLLRSDLNLTGELIFASAQPIDIAGVPLIVDYGDTDGDSFEDLIMISDSSAGLRGGGDNYGLNISLNNFCVGDLDFNGEVNVLDLLEIIAAWGNTEDTPEDLNDDGIVNVLDMLILIGAWGSCN